MSTIKIIIDNFSQSTSSISSTNRCSPSADIWSLHPGNLYLTNVCSIWILCIFFSSLLRNSALALSISIPKCVWRRVHQVLQYRYPNTPHTHTPYIYIKQAQVFDEWGDSHPFPPSSKAPSLWSSGDLSCPEDHQTSCQIRSAFDRPEALGCAPQGCRCWQEACRAETCGQT